MIHAIRTGVLRSSYLLKGSLASHLHGLDKGHRHSSDSVTTLRFLPSQRIFPGVLSYYFLLRPLLPLITRIWSPAPSSKIRHILALCAISERGARQRRIEDNFPFYLFLCF